MALAKRGGPKGFRTPPEPDFRDIAERVKRLADPNRLGVLILLKDGEESVGDLSAGLRISMSALSRHLAMMRLHGLVVARREGQRNFYSQTDLGRTLLAAIDRLIA